MVAVCAVSSADAALGAPTVPPVASSNPRATCTPAGSTGGADGALPARGDARTARGAALLVRGSDARGSAGDSLASHGLGAVSTGGRTQTLPNLRCLLLSRRERRMLALSVARLARRVTPRARGGIAG